MKKTYQKPVLVNQGILSRVAAQAGPSLEPSDIRLKTNVSRTGTTVFDLPLYRFSYLGGDQMFTGVMAQDVLDVMPDAVSCDASGFYHVDYGMLGIEMQRAA
jgi:hypothetical protein